MVSLTQLLVEIFTVFLGIAIPSTAALLYKKSYPPGHPVTAAMLRTEIKETHCLSLVILQVRIPYSRTENLLKYGNGSLDVHDAKVCVVDTDRPMRMRCE